MQFLKTKLNKPIIKKELNMNKQKEVNTSLRTYPEVKNKPFRSLSPTLQNHLNRIYHDFDV